MRKRPRRYARALRRAIVAIDEVAGPGDWPNANFTARFEFSGDGSRLQRSASFLRLARSIDEGTAGPRGLRFVTRSHELAGATVRNTEHRAPSTDSRANGSATSCG